MADACTQFATVEELTPSTTRSHPHDPHVADALGVGILMNAGPGAVHAPFAAFREFAKK